MTDHKMPLPNEGVWEFKKRVLTQEFSITILCRELKKNGFYTFEWPDHVDLHLAILWLEQNIPDVDFYWLDHHMFFTHEYDMITCKLSIV